MIKLLGLVVLSLLLSENAYMEDEACY